MSKIDLKKQHANLYTAPIGKFVELDVPPGSFVKVDGQGDPNTSAAYKSAIEWIYSVSYAMKFAVKAALQKDYVVPPLEGLWWADNPADFQARIKDAWRWTMMIPTPDFVDPSFFEPALAKTRKKLGEPPASLRFESYAEGACLQTLHIGSYDDEAPTLRHLHEVLIPKMRLTFAGPHHEIYLSDPRKTAPEKLKTILRQPVKALS